MLATASIFGERCVVDWLFDLILFVGVNQKPQVL